MPESICFRCNSTGLLCNICGEAEDACECTDDEFARYDREYPGVGHFSACEDCGGED